MRGARPDVLSQFASLLAAAQASANSMNSSRSAAGEPIGARPSAWRERPQHTFGQRPTAKPGTLDFAAVEPVSAKPQANIWTPGAALVKGRLGDGVTPAIRGPVLRGRTAQLAKGVKEGCGDALRIVFQMRLAPFWPCMKKPGFLAVAARLAAVTGDPEQWPLMSRQSRNVRWLGKIEMSGEDGAGWLSGAGQLASP